MPIVNREGGTGNQVQPERRVVHTFPFVGTLGGVQSMLRGHLRQDASVGLRSTCLAFFEEDCVHEARRLGLSLRWYHSIREARRRFRPWARAAKRSVLIYHEFWGAAFLADLDPSERRLAMFHSSPRGVGDLIGGLRGLFDGVICVSRAQAEIVSTVMPELGAGRITVLPNPVPWDGCCAKQLPLTGRPIRLGYSGRLEKTMKRVDRLPLVHRALVAAGVPFELEILGTGSQEGRLRRQFRKARNCTVPGSAFGGRVPGVDSGWDAVLFVSDTEGMPLALLEGLSSGVLPVFPRIGGAGEEYTARVSPELLYGAGDFAGIARAVNWLRSLDSITMAALRTTGHAVVEPHLGATYYESFRMFLDTVCRLPRTSCERFEPRPLWWADCVPFALLWRLRLAALYRSAARHSDPDGV